MNRFKGYKLIKKIIAMVMVITMTLGLCALNQSVLVKADDSFEQSISGFPNSYKTYLRQLHAKYPNWKFVPYNTGINFATAVSNESKNDRSLIENAYSKYLKSNASSDYNASTGTYIAKDGGTWVTASKNSVAYFMDPRNFLNEKHIFMFEQLSYDANSQTQEGVEAILQGSFMYKTNVSYLNTKGKYKTSDILYSQRIMDAAEQSGVSAYYIASKILQEIGTKKNSTYAGMGASGSVSGNYSSKYTGIYNFYNIGASSSSNPIANGLSWASSGTTYGRPWTTPGKSIIGGAQYIGEKYINCGQNTIYYQRFNVNKNSTYSLYTHQYMTNIYGAVNEAAFTYEAYESLGILSQSKTFIIPVYDDMPVENNDIKVGKYYYKNGVISSSVNVRKSPTTESDVKTTLEKGTSIVVQNGVMTNVGFGTKWLSNPYWYKIQYTKNKKVYTGYVAATYVDLNSEYTIIKGNSMNLPVTLDSSETVYYMSDNPAIATIDDNGNIIGKKAGKVVVRAFTAAGHMRATAVTVYSNGVTFDTNSVKLDIGKNYKLKTTVYPSGSTATVTYTSSNKAVATVSKYGNIKSKGLGTATIKAVSSTGGISATCIVTVVQPVTDVKLNVSTKTVEVGKTVNLKATLSPSNATDKSIKWSSSNKSVVTVSSTGQIKGMAAGTAVVEAKSHNGMVAKCTITVNPAKMTITGNSKNYNSVKISWTKTSNITGYWVYKKDSKGKYKNIATVEGDKTSFTDTNLTSGKTYSYKVKAYRLVGKTKYKSKNSSAISVMPIPGKPKITSIQSVKGGAKLTWKSIKGIKKYKIYRSESKTGTYKKIATVKNKTKYTNKGLQSGKTYYYKIVAYITVSKKSVNSNYSKVVSIKK